MDLCLTQSSVDGKKNAEGEKIRVYIPPTAGTLAACNHEPSISRDETRYHSSIHGSGKGT